MSKPILTDLNLNTNKIQNAGRIEVNKKADASNEVVRLDQLQEHTANALKTRPVGNGLSIDSDGRLSIHFCPAPTVTQSVSIEGPSTEVSGQFVEIIHPGVVADGMWQSSGSTPVFFNSESNQFLAMAENGWGITAASSEEAQTATPSLGSTLSNTLTILSNSILPSSTSETVVEWDTTPVAEGISFVHYDQEKNAFYLSAAQAINVPNPSSVLVTAAAVKDALAAYSADLNVEGGELVTVEKSTETGTPSFTIKINQEALNNLLGSVFSTDQTTLKNYIDSTSDTLSVRDVVVLPNAEGPHKIYIKTKPGETDESFTPLPSNVTDAEIRKAISGSGVISFVDGKIGLRVGSEFNQTAGGLQLKQVDASKIKNLVASQILAPSNSRENWMSDLTSTLEETIQGIDSSITTERVLRQNSASETAAAIAAQSAEIQATRNQTTASIEAQKSNQIAGDNALRSEFVNLNASAVQQINGLTSTTQQLGFDISRLDREKTSEIEAATTSIKIQLGEQSASLRAYTDEQLATATSLIAGNATQLAALADALEQGNSLDESTIAQLNSLLTKHNQLDELVAGHRRENNAALQLSENSSKTHAETLVKAHREDAEVGRVALANSIAALNETTTQSIQEITSILNASVGKKQRIENISLIAGIPKELSHSLDNRFVSVTAFDQNGSILMLDVKCKTSTTLTIEADQNITDVTVFLVG